MARVDQQSRDVSVAVQLGSIAVSWSAEGVSWNPSIARDMQDRAMSMLRETIEEAVSRGVLITTTEVIFDDGSGDYEEEEEDGDGE
jgi:hypothetical protein